MSSVTNKALQMLLKSIAALALNITLENLTKMEKKREKKITNLKT